MALNCGACGAPGAEFACSRCQAVRFCGQECFRSAWKAHKPKCVPVARDAKTTQPAKEPAATPPPVSSGYAAQQPAQPERPPAFTVYSNGQAPSVASSTVAPSPAPAPTTSAGKGRRVAALAPAAPAIPQTSSNATASGGAEAAKAALTLQQQGNWLQAIAKLEEAIALEANPVQSIQSRVNLGCALHNVNQNARAAEVLRDVLPRLEELIPRAPPPPHTARKHLAYLQCITCLNLSIALPGQVSVQRQLLEQALEFDPSCHQAMYQLGNILEEQENDLEGALPLAERALALAPEELNYLGLACRVYERIDRHQDAMRLCERIIRLDTASIYCAVREVFRCREQDTFVCTYPRCGTTWMVQVVSCIFHGADADYEDHSAFVEGRLASEASSLYDIEAMRAPRILKMHAPRDAYPGLRRGSDVDLQEHGKAIYVVRNPKDCCVSLRHHHANNHSIAWRGSWDEWIGRFLSGAVSGEYGGSYYEHVREWWKFSRLHPDRIHLVYFEDMKADLGSVIADIAEFLGCPVAADELDRIEQRCSFETMKGKFKVDKSVADKVNPEHFRKGEVGSWCTALTEVQAQRIDNVTRRELAEEIAQGLRLRDLPGK
eukprot:gnl/TRDRNA2_/TRDRNA2_156966_c0_seq1.p1 gnl/TRDRNA2_/TRDRNA2_156966_c0~~gnl/TRDRNA2_/TRDRNA2_156966_c0_seq1.p1  ORF type:complete len:605 (+),score=102.36 gnl/TRDRNA2_/TRDRNA2_156966_c0_seq1:1-1815(+)